MNNEMPSGTPSIVADITGKIRVLITAQRADYEIDQPVYALNWFNSRWLMLYNFYNAIAARSVLKIGGVPFFKARVVDTLYGNEADYRSVVLIVRYPSVTNFKTMLQSRYFQLVSIVRGMAVAQFTFGFSTRSDSQDVGEFNDQFRISESKVYAIHHYRSSDRLSEIAVRAAELAASHQVTLAFSSHVCARLYTQNGTNPPAAVETIMDGCMVLQADSRTHIDQWVASADCQELLATTDSSFIATLDRIF